MVKTAQSIVQWTVALTDMPQLDAVRVAELLSISLESEAEPHAFAAPASVVFDSVRFMGSAGRPSRLLMELALAQRPSMDPVIAAFREVGWEGRSHVSPIPVEATGVDAQRGAGALHFHMGPTDVFICPWDGLVRHVAIHHQVR